MVKIKYFCKLKYNRKYFIKFLFEGDIANFYKLHIFKIEHSNKKSFPFEKSNFTYRNSSVAGHDAKQLFH